jgi:predicted kinase
VAALSTNLPRSARLIVVTGLPATGKSTVGRRLAERFGMPMISKDAIKEPLLDCIGAPDAVASRLLSNASFAVLFAMTRELLGSGVDVLLEGNFRPGEHEPALMSVVQAQAANLPPCRIAQVLCRVDEATRVARLQQRAADIARHPGHRDARLVAAPNRQADDFLDVPGEKLLYSADNSLLDLWWRGS